MVVINLLSLSSAEVTNPGSLTLEIVQQVGEIDHSDLLLSMDEQISRAKEEASSRKAIMEKWVLACDEE
ncbi:hypothetical protein JHK82_027579 [Glycine max]|nr:hypothetical protein JHK85_028224 [Glycine max]KAG5126744.1 hypothetical protein JHK82_027579 [Glycine max]